MRDFLGREYGPGDLVIYGAMSGRCVNMIIGRVVEVYTSYESRDTYKWERLADGELPPFRKKHGWFDSEGSLQPERRDGLEFREYETGERVETKVKIKVQPLRGARWTQHSDKAYYVDARTGKRIDPTRGTRHLAVPSHYVDADGTRFPYEQHKEAHEARARHSYTGYYAHRNSYDWYFRDNYHVNYGPAGEIRLYGNRDYRSDEDKKKVQLWYVSRTYKDYVEERREGPRPVTIEVTDNIVRWDGELPEEEAA